jgi:four helix bundle protein
MGRFAKSFRDLDVYQRALELVVDINSFCDDLPSKEKYALADQMRRASRSVCSNITEAWRKRRYKAAFISKMSDAETEAGEMQCWLDVALKLAYMSKELHKEFDGKYEHLMAQIITMIRNADQWCALAPSCRTASTPIRRYTNTPIR